MRIGIVTPAPPRSRYGNRVTALRWARILKGLGHRVRTKQAYEGEPYDLLIALHARRSYPSALRFHRAHPERPLIVALTGTDLYHDLPQSGRARKSLELATLLVALQRKVSEELEPHLHSKVRVIHQSVSLPPGPPRFDCGGSRRTFDVCVIGHLRPVKDPFRAALAARRLPASSRVRILHVGAAMDEAMAERARAEMKINRRYRWLGEQPRWRVRQILERSAVCVLSSKLEGGANIVSEAIVAGTPVIASRIAGSVGLLGEDYPAYFEVGDTNGLAQLLNRASTDGEFLRRLSSHCRKLVPLFDPRRERKVWRQLLAELRPVLVAAR
ncbi:MAG TPA: selenoneine biosynthesis selenosugar synthase SenB [Terriglobia bacterium]|nr:selenoneine biosynthesis selenosugar synthase SenB [Terriglobia bacterium]